MALPIDEPAALDADELSAHDGFLRALARRLTADPHDADDLAQEAWLTLLQRRARQAVPLRRWSVGVMRNHARNAWRRERRSERLPDSVEPTARAAALDGELRAELAHALRALRPQARQVLELRYFQGLAPREIAARLELPVETVRTRIKRALRAIRERLDRRYGGDRACWVALLAPWAEEGHGPAAAGSGSAVRVVMAAGLVLPLATIALWPRGATGPEPLQRTVMARGAAGAELDAHAERAPLGVAAPASSSLAESVAVALPSTEAQGAGFVPQSTAGAAGSLHVRVVDGDRKGVPATVLLGDGHQVQQVLGKTDGDGDLVKMLEPLELRSGSIPGAERTLRIEAIADGYARSGIRIVPHEPRQATFVQIELGPRGAPLVGRVVDEGGAGVGGVHVLAGCPYFGGHWSPEGHFVQPSYSHVRTDATGHFRFESVPAGRVPLFLVHDGLVAESWWVRTGEDAVPNLVLPIRRGVVLTGVVRDGQGRPVAGAEVRVAYARHHFLPGSVTRAYTFTDAKGCYSMTGLAAEPCTAWALTCGGERVSASAQLDLRAEAVFEWSPMLTARPSLAARFVHADGSPVANRTVALRAALGPRFFTVGTRTDEHGRIEVEVFPDGPLTAEIVPRSPGGSGAGALRHHFAPLESAGVEQRIVVPDELSAPVQVRCRVVLFGGSSTPPRSWLTTYHPLRAIQSTVLPLAGAAHEQWLRPGRYELFVQSDLLGAASLGEHEVEGEPPVDLGTLRAPATARLVVEWPFGPEVGYDLRMLETAEGRAIDLRVDRSPGAPPEHFELFPGRWLLAVDDPRIEDRERVIVLEAGREARLAW